jgi:hypothetical protein
MVKMGQTVTMVIMVGMAWMAGLGVLVMTVLLGLSPKPELSSYFETKMVDFTPGTNP